MDLMRFPYDGSKVGISEPPSKPKPGVEPDLLVSFSPKIRTDSFVYVHCYFHNKWQDALIRIWNTSYLIDKTSGRKSALQHAENITIAPIWTSIADNKKHCFLLIFNGLPKSCTQFDFIEEVAGPGDGGFSVRNIRRNLLDVYHIEV